MNKPLVVGYKGEIGSFILSGLLRVMPKALDIWCSDINESEEEVKERIQAADTIFLCVPLQSTVDWLLKYKHLLKDKVIIEQCSLKEWIYSDDQLKDLDIRAMHLLFRPSKTPDKKDRTVALFSYQFNKDVVDMLIDVTDSYLILYKDAKQHDEDMAIKQALVHRVVLLLADMLERSYGSTYVSAKIIELAERVKQGEGSLYKLIQENKYLPDKADEFLKSFDDFEFEKYFK